MKTLALLKSIFPEAPRITKCERKLGDAVWNTRYLVCGHAVVHEDIRGRSNKVFSLRTYSASFSTPLINSKPPNTWEEEKMEAIRTWGNSAEKDKFLALCGWNETSPTQEEVNRIRKEIERAITLLPTTAGKAKLEISSPEENLQGEIKTADGAITVATFLGTETVHIGEDPNVRITIFEQPPSKVLWKEINAEKIVEVIQERARNCPDGLAFLGEKPWEDWKLESVKRSNEVVDEWTCTTLDIQLSGATNMTYSLARLWLEENQREVNALLGNKEPKPISEDGDGVDSPRKGTPFPPIGEITKNPEEFDIFPKEQKISVGRCNR